MKSRDIRCSCKMTLYCLVWFAVVATLLVWEEPQALSQTSVVARNIFSFMWTPNETMKIIRSTPGAMRAASDVATLEESRLTIGNVGIQCRQLTVFFRMDGPTYGVKVVGSPDVNGRTIWKIEAEDVVMLHLHEGGHATGKALSIDFLTGRASLNNPVVVSPQGRVVDGNRLLMNLRDGTSHLEGSKFIIMATKPF